MKTMHFVIAGVVLMLATVAAECLEADDKPAGYEKTAPTFTGMGDYHHAIETDVPLAQKYFDQGMVLMFGFNHAEAARSFREAQKLDPDCATAYWGEALALGPNINAAMDDENVPKAWAALQKAQEHAGNVSERHRDYIAALAKRYVAEPVEDRSSLDAAYADAMREVAEKYPNDYDAQCLFAESLMDMTPWDYWLKDGQPKDATKELLSALERVIARNPNHPLANHLYIHAVEAAHPEWGEACADRLGSLVPGAGHLVHMPSHIYIRVGRYADSRTANEKAITADNQYVTQCHAQGLYPLAYMPHNHHFLWFAATMEGRADQSIKAAQHLTNHVDQKMMRQPGFGALQHFYSMEMFGLLRFGRWEDLKSYPQPDADLKYPTGVWHYAQGLAAIRTGNTENARPHLRELRKLAADEELDKLTVMENNSTRHVLQVAEKVLAGEFALARGRFDKAVEHLRTAVDVEDAMKYDEPQLWYAPTRQFLGAALLQAGRPEDAEKVFREDLAKYPHNGWGLFGLVQALEAQDKSDEAAQVHKQFEKAWSQADVELNAARF